MIRIVRPQLIVENPTTHEKFYPKIISFSTQQSHPFSVSGATIDVVSNSVRGTSGYSASLFFNDIVRLGISIKYNDDKMPTVWQDLFHGRIQDLSSGYGKSNTLKLYVAGHEAEAKTDLIEETKSYTAATDAKTLLQYFSKYFSQLSYSDSYAQTGVSFPSYDTTKDQQFIADLFSEMEKNAGYDWAVKVVPTYSANKNLSTRYVSWKPFSTTPAVYQVLEGTYRLISADFDVEGEAVRTFRRIYGYTPETTGATQYTGSAIDAALVARYGKRSAVDTYPWIKTNALCSTVAEGMLKGEKQPVTSGQVLIIGTPEAQIGDYVYVDIPSEEINGSPVKGFFYVYRVQHIFDKGQFSTLLDLGKVKKVAEDYIAQVSKVASLCKCSLVKKPA